MGIKILLVDDDELSSTFFARRLIKRDLQVELCHDGRLVLEQIKKNKPDIVVLDLMLPKISGIELLSEIRKIYSQIELSVVVMTDRTDLDDVLLALKKGANDFIVRPTSIEIVVARLNTQYFAIRSHQDEVVKNELEAMNAMIATYNHEINNPLTIAFGYLWKLKKENNPEYIKEVENSLNRVVKIVKQIETLATTRPERELYAKEEKFFKVT